MDNQAKITKMDVLTPGQVYRGNEEARWAMSRNEGPEIVLHFSPEDFVRVKARIETTPVLGLNEDLYRTGDNGTVLDYKSPREEIDAETQDIKTHLVDVLGEKGSEGITALLDSIPSRSSSEPTREEARASWKQQLDSTATLFHEDGFVINAHLGGEPNTVVIVKEQEDPRGDGWFGHVDRNTQNGSRGTRAMDVRDVQRLSYALEHALGIEVTPALIHELGEGIENAKPKRGYAPRKELDALLARANVKDEYVDLPGRDHSASFSR